MARNKAVEDAIRGEATRQVLVAAFAQLFKGEWRVYINELIAKAEDRIPDVTVAARNAGLDIDEAWTTLWTKADIDRMYWVATAPVDEIVVAIFETVHPDEFEEEEDDADPNDEIADAVTCPVCDSLAVRMGRLGGARVWYRCRGCGLEFAR